MKFLGRGAILGLALVAVFAIGLTTNVIQLGIPLNAQSDDLGYASCSFAGFLPTAEGVEYRSSTPAGSAAQQADYRPITEDFGGTLLCPLNLPHGAELRRVSFDLYSASQTGVSELVDCFFKRQQIVNTFSTPRAETIVQVGGTPVFNRTQRSGTVISGNNSIVDNANYSYYVSCSIPQNDADIGVVGAVVEYAED